MATPASRLEKLLVSGKFTDVTFIIKNEQNEEKIFNVHKNILAMTSEIFEAMFFGSMPETEKVIHLKGVQPVAFTMLLQYIYTGSVTLISVDDTIDIAYAAKMYLMNDLFHLCTAYLKKAISHQNACSIFEASRLLDDPALSEACVQLIKTKSDLILKSSNFTSLLPETVLDITKLLSTIVKANHLFVSLFNWAKHQPKEKTLREILDPMLPFIPFLSLTEGTFLDTVGATEVLTDQECLAIAMNINKSKKESAKLRPLPTWCCLDIPDPKAPKEVYVNVDCENSTFQEINLGKRTCEFEITIDPNIISKRQKIYLTGISIADCFFIDHLIYLLNFCCLNNFEEKSFHAEIDSVVNGFKTLKIPKQSITPGFRYRVSVDLTPNSPQLYKQLRMLETLKRNARKPNVNATAMKELESAQFKVYFQSDSDAMGRFYHDRAMARLIFSIE